MEDLCIEKDLTYIRLLPLRRLDPQHSYALRLPSSLNGYGGFDKVGGRLCKVVVDRQRRLCCNSENTLFS